MSSSSSSSAAAQRPLYRTRSDTLKLQRLIDVLKERGSDLGDTLETAATEFLSDVKKKEKKDDGKGEGAAPGGIAAILTAGLPQYNPSNDDAGSSFDEASAADDEEFEWDDQEPPVAGTSGATVPAIAGHAAVAYPALVPPPPPSPSPLTDLNDSASAEECRAGGESERGNDHVGRADAMEQLDEVTEEEEDGEGLNIPENPVPQIPALVRIPLCPPPIPLIPPPPVPTDDLCGGGGRGDDLGGEMWARGRRRSSAAAAGSARKDSCMSSSDDGGGGVAELVRKSSTVLGQLIRVDKNAEATVGAHYGAEDDEDIQFADGGRVDGRREGELLLSEASSRLSELSVRGASGVKVIVSPSYSSPDRDSPEHEGGHGACAGTELRREEGELLSAAEAPQKRAKLRSSTTRARKKSTLASKWRRQRERQRSREPSPPSLESPPPSPFDNVDVTQALSNIS